MRFNFAFLFLPIALVASCSTESPTPLPKGYFRIDLPERKYVHKEFGCPFSFEASERSRLEFFTDGPSGERCWFDMYYPDYRARIHFTYKDPNNQLRAFIEEARGMAYEHHIKANKIERNVVADSLKRVYGMAYSLEGNVASHFQFYLTDSVHHFLRGSLYFEAKPNQDSIRPVLDHIKQDMDHLIDTFRWEQ